MTAILYYHILNFWLLNFRPGIFDQALRSESINFFIQIEAFLFFITDYYLLQFMLEIILYNFIKILETQFLIFD